MLNQYEIESLPNGTTAQSLANLASAMQRKGKTENAIAGGYTLRGYWGNSSIYLENADGDTVCKVIPA